MTGTLRHPPLDGSGVGGVGGVGEARKKSSGTGNSQKKSSAGSQAPQQGQAIVNEVNFFCCEIFLVIIGVVKINLTFIKQSKLFAD
jgi:hypothetical protein